MTRGYSLEQDLKLLINNPKYSDLEILCENEKKLYGCRAILAARSEVFERLLYNGMKESYENQISFPKINSAGMEIVLEYTYTGSIKEEFLTKDNMIESFYAAEYFQLPDLQDFIMKVFKNTLKKNLTENYSPELLSKFAEKMPLTEDNVLLNLLVEAVAIIPLNTIEFGRLSIAGLKYLLSCTYEKEMTFSTPEYEVFRYRAILAAKQVSNDAYTTLMKLLPTLEQMQMDNSVQVKNKFITDHQNVAKELKPLVEFIDFKRIKGQILTDVIDPLEIIPSKIILNVYRDIVRSNNSNLNYIRGIPTMYVWDEKECICSSENFNYKSWAGGQSTGWVLGSSGNCFNSGTSIGYCSSFKDGTKITVHLDMNKRTCAFTVNGIKYPEVSGWNNLPSKLYPVVSLKFPGLLRIQTHQKI
ncbi:hypothetical protein GLOIN_2v1802430 [Rhizophagus irregularis DAOM 181602=DAOM 197198]|uniref:BTB domain-containing protein n=1 Tax=Rhizophagus irregularis (strain DAOM 181602 / DAOM 197198 / MUCL 43194) TaxID=747089 RepID=A0A2P4PM05_RHIID|nr:hypothetical protein GLOIN_2v1802430 [Rhizophagus irregularis DAOM 181602=DAOM 197198]POG66424.1 hypothetical protein GLOIN_2v1802430 [Rhizophagus irregularis DAOM 181602=DAOM 197198]|eukprot:XP_025173290.1 hypothetical protein GLOIN_2v1802430 [Rhizophagus irregularis DAOM 181602=DAOM 197198]